MTLPFDCEPADLDQLRAWAREWNHLHPLATQVYRLFEEWDAANAACEQLQEEPRL